MKFQFSIFVSFVAVILIGCQPPSVAVPDTFESWNSKDGSFMLDYPANWESKGNGSKQKGISWAEFVDGAAKIRIDTSFQDAVLGDIADFGGGSGMLRGVDEEDIPTVKSRESVMHKFWLDHYREKYKGYSETEGEPERIKLGPSYRSEFTAKAGFAKVKGIRSTITTRDRGVTFFAYCPEAQWEEFKPVFLHCLESMKMGIEKL